MPNCKTADRHILMVTLIMRLTLLFFADGDTDYAALRPTVTADGSNATTYTNDVGMHLWYASDSTTFQQYGWRDGFDHWEKQDNWTVMNGHAGVGCYTWGPGTVTYTMMVNKENTLEVWYGRSAPYILHNTTKERTLTYSQVERYKCKSYKYPETCYQCLGKEQHCRQ
jgi:hypothetical protein